MLYFTPIFEKTESICSNDSILTFLIVNSLLVNAANPIQLPISIISGWIVCEQPPSLSTPFICNKFDPIPLIEAPIEINIEHNCCIYGSHAAL